MDKKNIMAGSELRTGCLSGVYVEGANVSIQKPKQAKNIRSV